MQEFNNRIELQREVIKTINNSNYSFEITGISQGSIERWALDNNISINSEIVKLLYKISNKLFFLSNKSQEQITEDYRKIKSDISKTVNELKFYLQN